MNIWLIAENWPPRRGGIENYLWHLAEYCGRAGCSVTVIAPIAESEQEERSLTNGRVIRRRFFIPLVRPRWIFIWLFLRRLYQQEKPDVILCGKALFEGRLGHYFWRRYGVPYVVFTYGLEINTWSKSWRWRRLLSLVLKHAYRVIHISEAVVAILLQHGVKQKQLLKIAPGVDERFFHTVAPALIEATLRHYKLRQPYILSVGRLIERKGFDTLISAFSRLEQITHEDVQLVIVGDGPDRKRLEALAVDEWVGRSVHILTDVPDHHLTALYAGAQIFALAPRDVAGDIEGFGIVYGEASAVGRPIVATKTGGVPEAVQADITGLVVNPTVEAVQGALTQLLRDPSLQKQLGQAGKARAQQEFQWVDKARLLLQALASKPKQKE